MKAYYSFEESLRQPMDSLINFEYLLTHPEAKYQVWEKFRFDYTFKKRVNERIFLDPSFKKRWFNFFAPFYKSLAVDEEYAKEKPTIKAFIKKF